MSIYFPRDPTETFSNYVSNNDPNEHSEDRDVLVTTLALGTLGPGIGPRVYSSHKLVHVPYSLEEKFFDQVRTVSAPRSNTDFHDSWHFLSPNECKPKEVQPHLDKMEPGLIVSTGTQRSFFDLLLSDERCTGLVIRDLNSYAKYYTDFLTLLLRISKNQDEFIALSTNPTRFGMDERIEDLEKKIKEDPNLHFQMKEYYLNVLDKLTGVYYRVDHFPEGDFDSVNYFSDETLFKKLQKYAREGNIISTLGDIGDLTFLNQPISIIDVSNISEFGPINLSLGNQPNSPRVIWTNFRRDPCHIQYCSYIHESLAPNEKEEFLQHVQTLISAQTITRIEQLQFHFYKEDQNNQSFDEFNATLHASFSKPVLNHLKQYVLSKE